MFRCAEVLQFVTILLIVCQFSHGKVFTYGEEVKNVTRPFSLRVVKLLCINQPYEETVVKECRVILRRNERSLICVSIYVPKVYHQLFIQFRLHYKFTTYKPLLIDGEIELCSYSRGPKKNPLENYVLGVMQEMLPNTVHPCPHGNKTYNERTVYKEEYAPKSMPAGDYRMDIRFASSTN
uniref:MD-2-related lipid-recognition domain-containing protein n=1 Tax=Anopheles minimus TaxID=112268 RepID=A0A182W0R5_9DIPT